LKKLLVLESEFAFRFYYSLFPFHYELLPGDVPG